MQIIPCPEFDSIKTTLVCDQVSNDYHEVFSAQSENKNRKYMYHVLEGL